MRRSSCTPCLQGKVRSDARAPASAAPVPGRGTAGKEEEGTPTHSSKRGHRFPRSRDHPGPRLQGRLCVLRASSRAWLRAVPSARTTDSRRGDQRHLHSRTGSRRRRGRGGHGSNKANATAGGRRIPRRPRVPAAEGNPPRAG